MNAFSKFLSILVLCTTQMHAHAPRFETNHQLNGVNKESLFLIKRELEISKKVLLEIRDCANPGVISSAASTLGTVIKELTYIISSGLLVGCPVAGVCSIINMPINGELLLVGVPALAVSWIITYTLLKLIFGKLLSSSPDETRKNIQEALVLIDQTLNKLDYEITKIDRVAQGLPA